MRLLLVAVVADETSAFPVFSPGNAGVPPAWTSITGPLFVCQVHSALAL